MMLHRAGPEWCRSWHKISMLLKVGFVHYDAAKGDVTRFVHYDAHIQLVDIRD